MTWITPRQPLAGAQFPFLERLHCSWAMKHWSVDEPETACPQTPTLRWLNDSTVVDLYVQTAQGDIMATDAFLDAIGLRLSMHKGGYVLSKRLSRLFRPYSMFAFFARDAVRVRYLEQTPRQQKIWDGAGRVSRAFLLRVLDQLSTSLPRRKRQQMVAELKTAKRLEFTLMGLADNGGQDKGHFHVQDDLDVDVELPCDTKSSVCLVDGTVFVGLMPVHHRDEMRLDVQSLINLHPFFKEETLLTWLRAEGELFMADVESGDVARSMARVDDLETVEDIASWHVREYLVSGGDVRWFGSITKGVIHQHLKRIRHTALHKLKLPIPGARYYVMCDDLGHLRVERGTLRLDPDSATAWINADDWCDFAADIWGGADQDDALWIFPFTDVADGERKFLAWRSPNQVGEYLVLRPAEDSHLPGWETVTNTIQFPTADSRQLPPRIDRSQPDYLHLVDDTVIAGLGDDLPKYTVAGMTSSLHRAEANKGVLGQLCNALMLAKALYGGLPQRPPASLETVIDASVKSGADLSRVRQWCFDASRMILAAGKPIPFILQDRLSIDYEEGKRPSRPRRSRDHWIDTLLAGVEAHIAWVEMMRDELMSRTMPPMALFQAAFQHPDTLDMGAQLTQRYTAKLPWTKRHKHPRRALGLDIARAESEALLADYGADQQRAILRGALAHYYLKGHHSGADEVAWQLGAETEEGRDAGIAQWTIQALREVGILNEIADIDGRILSYPAATILPLGTPPLEVRNVWFNWHRVQCQRRGDVMPERLQDVSKADERQAKVAIDDLLHTHLRGMQLMVQACEDRLVLMNTQGSLFGYIAREDSDRLQVGQSLQIRFALQRRGHLLVMYNLI